MGRLRLKSAHRLLCGDATQAEDVALLMAGAKANMVFTDPPYGVNIVSRVGTPGVANSTARASSRVGMEQERADARAGGALAIENDDLSLAELTAFLDAAFANTLEATQPGAAWYVTAPHNPIGLAFALALTKIDVWKHSLVWVKSSLVLSRADYHYRHEPIYYGWSPGAAHHAIVDRTEDTVWSIPRPLRSLEHPTMKPVELIERAIRNSTEAGAVVLDTFVGSGSTLIAAERLARRAYAMEIDPHYVDVAVRRWEQFTGQTAILAATRNAPEGALSAVPAAA